MAFAEIINCHLGSKSARTGPTPSPLDGDSHSPPHPLPLTFMGRWLVAETASDGKRRRQRIL